MVKKPKPMKVDQRLVDIFEEMKKEGKVYSFPEFTRRIADDLPVVLHKKKKKRESFDIFG